MSSPRAYASPGGSNTRGSAGSDDRRPRSTVTGPSERISSGSNGKGRKSLEVDNAGGREDAGEGSGRIRVAVRVSTVLLYCHACDKKLRGDFAIPLSHRLQNIHTVHVCRTNAMLRDPHAAAVVEARSPNAKYGHVFNIRVLL